jgi:hypothetical protein
MANVETKKFGIGVQNIFVRLPDGTEESLGAVQDASINNTFALNKKYGDDSRVPLNTIVGQKDVKITGKHAQTSLKLLNYLQGGTFTGMDTDSYSAPESDTADASMKTAITINSTTATPKVTDIFSFFALSASTYKVIQSSTGAVVGTFSTSAYPNTAIVPGLSITVDGTLVVGSVANIKTSAIGESVEVRDEDKNDAPGYIALRVITEPSPSEGQIEILYYSVRSGGINVTLKTLEHAEFDFSFEPRVEPTLGKISQWRTLSTPS